MQECEEGYSFYYVLYLRVYFREQRCGVSMGGYFRDSGSFFFLRSQCGSILGKNGIFFFISWVQVVGLVWLDLDRSLMCFNLVGLFVGWRRLSRGQGRGEVGQEDRYSQGLGLMVILSFLGWRKFIFSVFISGQGYFYFYKQVFLFFWCLAILVWSKEVRVRFWSCFVWRGRWRFRAGLVRVRRVAFEFLYSFGIYIFIYSIFCRVRCGDV